MRKIAIAGSKIYRMKFNKEAIEANGYESYGTKCTRRFLKNIVTTNLLMI